MAAPVAVSVVFASARRASGLGSASAILAGAAALSQVATRRDLAWPAARPTWKFARVILVGTSGRAAGRVRGSNLSGPPAPNLARPGRGISLPARLGVVRWLEAIRVGPLGGTRSRSVGVGSSGREACSPVSPPVCSRLLAASAECSSAPPPKSGIPVGG